MYNTSDDDEYEELDMFPNSYLIMRHLMMNRVVSESTAPLTEIQYWIIKTHIDNLDESGALELIRDWNNERKTPIAEISKWIPGDHYYALDKKFNALDEAISYLRSKGFRFSGKVRERFQYKESGG